MSFSTSLRWARNWVNDPTSPQPQRKPYMTSEELTPEDLREWLRSIADLMGTMDGKRFSAAADLIESQQARIAELEAALRPLASLDDECIKTRPDDWCVYALNESEVTVGDIKRAVHLLAASPDTPETRPERCAWCGDAVPEGDGVRQVSLGTIFHSGCTPTDWPCGAFIGDPETRPLQRACVSCGGTGQDSTAVALERLGAVLPLRCGECGGSGLVDPEEGR